MTWILILVLTASPGGVAIRHIEFKTEAACNAALAQIGKPNIAYSYNYVCVSKGA